MNSAIKEILPTHFSNGYSQFKFSGVVGVVMISNPIACGACRMMEPEYNKSFEIARKKGSDKTIIYMVLHLNHQAWRRVGEAELNVAIRTLAPHFNNMIPEFAIISKARGENSLKSSRPFSRDAEGIFMAAVQRYGAVLENADLGTAVSITRHRAVDEYYDQGDDSDFGDEEEEYSLALANFHDMRSMKEPTKDRWSFRNSAPMPTVKKYNKYCGYCESDEDSD